MSGPRRSLARAALIIAVLTVLARVAGFVRTAVFGRSVGTGCVGSVYQTANTIPNIVFDVVAGGMLAALVVPVLAPALAAGGRAQAERLAGALLGWTLVVLVPLAVLVAVFSRPIVELLLGRDACPGAVGLGTRMLLVFAPQIVFYGLGVVLGGLLTASERFTLPALAPLLSSLTVIGCYLWYGAWVGAGRGARDLPSGAEYVLSVGTSIGVVVLALCQLPAVRRLGLTIRPTLRFPAGTAASVRSAAAAGAATLAAQQLAAAVMIRLANDHTPTGTLVVVVLAQAVYLLPWAVLTFPVATASFPRLATAWGAGERADYRRRLGFAVRAVVALAAGGTAVLVAVGQPARAILLGANASAAAQFAPAVTAFAIGLLGWSLVAVLGRALYAVHAMAASAVAQVLGQAVVIAADLVLCAVVAPEHRAVALAAGNAVGVGVAGLALLVIAGRRQLVNVRRLLRPAAASGVAAAAGAVSGWLVGRHAASSIPSGLTYAAVAGAVAVAVFTLVLAGLDRSVLRELARAAGTR
jgi:putative peptidoglycan lipid II flippase